MKRILMVSHHKLDDGSGDATRVKKIGGLLEGSLEVEYLGDTFPKLLFKLFGKLVSRHYDYVYCYNQRYVVIFINLVKCLFFKKFKIIYDTLLTWKLQGEPAIRDIVETFAGSCADYVITVSELSRDYYKSKSPLLIPTLVDTDKFRINQEERLEVRKRYGLTDKDKVVGLVGGFDNEYNRPSLDYLRKHINDFNKRIKFLVIGKTKYEIGHWRIVFTGYVEDYVETLSALDALLVYRTIPTDGAINRIVEAMAMGIPIIANEVANKSMDYAGSHYFVCGDEDIPNLVNKVVLNGVIENMRDNGKKVVEEYYSDKIYKEKLLGVLR